MTRDERLRTRPREVEHGLLAERMLDVGKRRHREVVVVDVETVTPGVRERKDAGRTTASADGSRTEGPLIIRLHEALGNECVEVAAHHRRAVAQPPSEL